MRTVGRTVYYLYILRIRIRQSVGLLLLCLLDARQTKTLSHLVVLFCGKSDGVRGFGLYNCWFADRPRITGPSNLPVTPLHYTSRPVLVGSFPNLKPHKQGAVRPLSQWPQPFQTIRMMIIIIFPLRGSAGVMTLLAIIIMIIGRTYTNLPSLSLIHII